jgi:tetratricopeptide (TPR) repeat protein
MFRLLPRRCWVTTLLLVSSLPLLTSLLASQSPAIRTEAVQRHLAAAKQAQAAGDFAKAAEEYMKALRLQPKSAEIYQNLGLVYHLQNNYREAIPAFQKALALQPSLWGSNLFLGIGYYKTNQFSRALPLFRKALELDPKNAEVEGRFWLGVTHLALHQYSEAIAELEKRLEHSPPDIEVLYNLVQAHNQFSAQLFDRLLTAYPQSARAYQYLGDTHQAAGRLDEALEEYETALSEQPNLEGVRLTIGRVYQKMGDMAKAAEAFESELRLNPYDTEARSQLELAQQSSAHSASAPVDPAKPSSLADSRAEGQDKESLTLKGIGLFHHSQWQESAEIFQSALGLDPNDKRSRLYLARCLLRLGLDRQAFEALQGLLENSRTDPDTLYTLGSIQAELASSTLQKMIEIAPHSYRVHQMEGESFEKQEQYPKALEAYKTALALKPDLPGIRFAIGSVHWKTREFDDATRWLQEELKANPHHAIANYQLGNIYVYRNQPSQAIPYLQETVSALPQFMEAHRDLGKALLQLGEFDKAVEHFKLVAQTEPEDDAIHSLLASAYRKQGKLEEQEAELELFQQLNQKKLERAQRRVQKVR